MDKQKQTQEAPEWARQPSNCRAFLFYRARSRWHIACKKTSGSSKAATQWGVSGPCRSLRQGLLLSGRTALVTNPIAHSCLIFAQSREAEVRFTRLRSRDWWRWWRPSSMRRHRLFHSTRSARYRCRSTRLPILSEQPGWFSIAQHEYRRAAQASEGGRYRLQLRYLPAGQHPKRGETRCARIHPPG